MTLDEARRERIRLYQADLDGPGIQYRSNGSWRDMKGTDITLEEIQAGDWRIKPKPRECWVVWYPEGGPRVTPDPALAREYENDGGHIQHVIEETP